MDLNNIPKSTTIYEETTDYIILDDKEKVPMIMWKERTLLET